MTIFSVPISTINFSSVVVNRQIHRTYMYRKICFIVPHPHTDVAY